MAKVKTFNGALRVSELPLFGDHTVPTATSITVSDDQGNSYVLKGAFTYDQTGPHGTITAIEFYQNDVLNFRVTDLAHPVEPIVSPDSVISEAIASIQSGDDRVFGAGGDDIMTGFAGSDRIFGMAGNDQLIGQVGKDYLSGGDGNDVLVGGNGRDRLLGGLGADIFGYVAASDSDLRGTGRDHILDFSSAEGDKIALRGIDGDFETPLSVVNAFSHTAGELVIRADGDSHFSVFVDLDGNGRADFALAVTTTDNHVLVASDFIL